MARQYKHILTGALVALVGFRNGYVIIDMANSLRTAISRSSFNNQYREMMK